MMLPRGLSVALDAIPTDHDRLDRQFRQSAIAEIQLHHRTLLSRRQLTGRAQRRSGRVPSRPHPFEVGGEVAAQRRTQRIDDRGVASGCVQVEDITVSGLHWPDVRPGVRLQVGDVVCDVSSFAVPCSQNTEWFIGGDFRLMHHDRGPVSRVYATVLQPGRISKGDAVVLEP